MRFASFCAWTRLRTASVTARTVCLHVARARGRATPSRIDSARSSSSSAIADVPVQGGRLDLKPVGQGAHGQRLQPLLVDQLEGGDDEPLPSQRASLLLLFRAQHREFSSKRCSGACIPNVVRRNLTTAVTNIGREGE